MKKLIPLLTNGLLVLAFYLVLANSTYASYGENYISFIGIICLVGGVIGAFTLNTAIDKGVKNPTYKAPNKVWSTLLALVRIAAACLAASLGWYYVAVGFLMYESVTQVIETEIKKGKANG